MVPLFDNTNFRPTFKLFKDGREVDSVRGADPKTLEAKINQHYVVPQSTGGSESEASSSQLAAAVNGYPDITSNVDVKNVDQTVCDVIDNRLNV